MANVFILREQSFMTGPNRFINILSYRIAKLFKAEKFRGFHDYHVVQFNTVAI